VVGSVGVALADLAVFPMDEHFAALVFGDSPGGFDGGSLSAQDLRGVGCTGGLDCPTLRVWDDVLVPFHWMRLLSIFVFRLQDVVGEKIKRYPSLIIEKLSTLKMFI
jgi:hypothetical protein